MRSWSSARAPGWAGSARTPGRSRSSPATAVSSSVGPVRRLLGVGAGQRGIDVRKSIHIAAPPEELYRFFMAAENFPRFMQHVREVRVTGEARWHWRVEGPSGIEVEWDAEVTRTDTGRLISWKTVDNSTVESSGTVRFVPDGDGTRVD